MNRRWSRLAFVLMAAALIVGCGGGEVAVEDGAAPSGAAPLPVAQRLGQYTEFTLTADLSGLTAREREMVPLLIAAADAMNDIYWQQAYGDGAALLASIDDPDTRRLVEINFGPWDRLDGNAPFVDGVGPKPLGANLYPADATREEIEAAGNPALTSLYTVVRRNDDGSLSAVPYHEAYAEPTARAAASLRAAAELADDPGLRRYLGMRAEALESDDYQASDFAWMEMKDNTLELVIGPIETYEDQLFGAKAAHEGYVLLKDQEWSARLARYAAFLPSLQEGLPVEPAYKAEVPGTDAELNAYDVLYAAGDGNAGSKTIAINLPNDEQVQLRNGTRRLQLKNAMRAKFEAILEPIAAELIAVDQRQHVTFDAFFANTMFHEVAHGLGIKNTLDGSSTVRGALQDQASWLEEGKADILGLYMITALHERGELGDADLMDNYVTFFTSIFRSVRFGPTSAHGRANLVRFNYFADRNAFSFDPVTGTYAIDFVAMQQAMNGLSERILTLQGDGDRAGVAALYAELGVVGEGLQAALDRLASASIPVDLVYRQGLDVLTR